jgi:DNA gyrase subunit A
VDGDELMIITKQGQMIRMPVKGISVIGRNTQGVRLVNLAPSPAAEGTVELLPDTVGGVTRVVSEDDEAASGDSVGGAEVPAAAGDAEGGAGEENGEDAS